MTARKRKCVYCKSSFPREDGIIVPAGYFCGLEHALMYTKRTRRKKPIRDRAWHIKTAQRWFNRWVRERDRDMPCISCGTTKDVQYHAGHYRSVASAPQLRFDPHNCHKQCAQCNKYRSGNLIAYKINLIDRIGAQAVAALESDTTEKPKLAISDLEKITERYKMWYKRLEQENIGEEMQKIKAEANIMPKTGDRK